MRYKKQHKTPIGVMTLVETDSFLTELSFSNDIDFFARSNTIEMTESALLKETINQLDAYFNGTLKLFDIPLAPQGTLFQKRVWQELQNIPYGETCSYGDIACRIGNQKACRAVGLANNRNPMAIIIPCHRVIGSSGKLIGYAAGLHIKSYLLQLEAKKIPNTLF